MRVARVGAAHTCMKHENMHGIRFCTEVAKSPIVDRPDFSQLIHNPKRLRIAARASDERAAKDMRCWMTPSRYSLEGGGSLTEYSDMSGGAAVC